MSGRGAVLSWIVSRRLVLGAMLGVAALTVLVLAGLPGPVGEPPVRQPALPPPVRLAALPQAGPVHPERFTIQGTGADTGSQPAGEVEVTFIVRLRNAPEVNIISRSFRRDPEAARAAWKDLTRRIPLFSEFDLVGASYAGEIHVARRLPVMSEDRVRDIQAALLAIEGVVYADPDSIAHPGEKDPP